MAVLPHVLHHAGPLAGAALVAGAGGTILFAVIGFAATIPLLLGLRRRFHNWVAPGIAVAVFAVAFSLSTILIAPSTTVLRATAPAAGAHSLPSRIPLAMSRTTRLLLTALVAMLGIAGTAQAATSSATRGSQLMSQLARGSMSCRNLSSSDFAAIGEFAMQRMLGSPGAGQSMDQLMSQMMGQVNEARVHQAMGRRFAGCGNPPIPGGFGAMMGAAGMMGRGAGGMMGPGAADRFGAFDRENEGDHNVPAGWIVAMIVILVLGAAGAVYAIHRTTGRRPDARRILDQRLASGEIDQEEYRRRSELLGGPR